MLGIVDEKMPDSPMGLAEQRVVSTPESENSSDSNGDSMSSLHGNDTENPPLDSDLAESVIWTGRNGRLPATCGRSFQLQTTTLDTN